MTIIKRNVIMFCWMRFTLYVIVINIHDVKMSGEGATSGLIGELPPLPLSVLHSPSDIRSTYHSRDPVLFVSSSNSFHSPLSAQPDLSIQPTE